jgi:hypothetical protein
MTSECWDEPAEIPPRTLWDVLSAVPDHRHASGRRYPLPALLTIALAAMLCGRTSQAGIVRWSQGLARADLKALGIRERRTPCPSTWCLLFQGLNVAVLEQQLAAWVQGDRTRLGHVAVDGKRLRGSRDGENRGVHLLAAFSNELKGLIGTIAVPSETTEAKAMLTLLKQLPLTGLVITADAAFTQRDIARDIVAGGGQYFLVVKDNQAMLRREIEGAVGPASPHSSLSGALSPDAGHG